MFKVLFFKHFAAGKIQDVYTEPAQLDSLDWKFPWCGNYVIRPSLRKLAPISPANCDLVANGYSAAETTVCVHAR